MASNDVLSGSESTPVGPSEDEVGTDGQGLHADDSWFGREIVDRVRRWWRRRGMQREVNREDLKHIRVRIREVNEERVKKLESNEVCTSKYKWWSFLFVAFLLQLRRGGNSFFVLICVINSIGYFFPNLFVVSYVPFGTIAILVFVIAVALGFEARDDIERHNADRVTNNKPVRKIDQDGMIVTSKWGKLKPGDVIRLEKGEYIPADVLIIRTSFENGFCYIETSGIDGETNLKIRTAPKELRALELDGTSIHGTIECEEANAFLQFTGSLVLDDGNKIGVGFNSMILRGSQLRNTAWVEAVVVYAGPETKLIQSSGETPSKFARIDTVVNRMIGYVVVAYLLIVILAVLLLVLWIPNTNTFWYFMYVDTVNDYILPSWLAFFFTFSGTFASVVPINMYVCLEIVNFVLGRYINWDVQMYDEKTNTAAVCRTGSLVAEIGQITHIFSDKTGTLTNNEMKLVGTSIHGNMYGFKPDLADPDQDQDPESLNITPPAKPVQEIFEDLIAEANSDSHITDFLLVLALCHTVVIDHNKRGEIEYNAEGPDEEALVSAAGKLGMKLCATEDNTYKIEARDGSVREFNVLGVNAFTSARKRMSVIVEEVFQKSSNGHQKVGDTWLYMKGADNIMLSLGKDFDGDLRDSIDEHLSRYSLAGLRTLVIGGKKLSPTERDDWATRYEQAGKEIGGARKKALAQVAALVENDIDIYGVTAIEDALQDGVPETIQMIRDGGINLWVLTGDKIQTAINIALSSRILDSSMTRILIEEKPSRDELLQAILDTVAEIDNLTEGVAASTSSDGHETSATSSSSQQQSSIRQDGDGALDLESQGEETDALLGSNALERDGSPERHEAEISSAHPRSLVTLEACENIVARHVALVVSGAALQMLLQDEEGTTETQAALLQLTSKCSVVLACRVSPQQKALLVRMVENGKNVKKYKKPLTLAIGDGANDVAMIQEARVGIGLSGHEGLQAANASDFSIARFKFLRELLFVHGRWNYMRCTFLVKYICYSWILLIVPVFMYLFYSMISGQSIYPNTYYTTLFAWVTNSVITAIAWFQKDIKRTTVFENPWVYQIGRTNRYMNGFQILKMCARSFIASALIIGCAFYTLPNTVDLDTIGAVIFTSIFLVLFCRQLLIAMTIPVFIIICFLLCAILFIVGVTVCDVSALLTGPGFPLLFDPSSAPLVWSRGFLTCLTGVCMAYLFLGVPRIYFPDDLQLIREVDRYPDMLSFTEGTPPPATEPPRRSLNRRASKLVRQASQRLSHLESMTDYRSFV